MAYDHSVVDQVQSLNDIVEVIGTYIPLKRAGRNFKALCPFHKEKTPSFIVNPDKQIFHCFGCSVGGDVFSFLMKHESMNFPEALRLLAERVHFRLPESSSRDKEETSRYKKFLLIYESAYQYYRANYEDPVRGTPARRYVKERAFSEETAKTFGLGYAVDTWRGLFESLSKKGFPQDLILSSGLVVRSSRDKSPYDLMRRRLIFPIFNVQGKVIAFGGRILSDELPKYINSPESEIFRKRSQLYGLHLAKRCIPEEKRQLLVTEGYFDLIRLHEAGIKNVVATLGTALTEDHARIIHRYADEVVLVFDGDKAGEAASLRGLDIFLEEGLTVKLMVLPKGYDPDDFVLKNGKDAFLDRLNGAEDLFEFKLRVLSKRYPKGDSLGLVKIASEVLDTLLKVKSSILLDRYVQKLSETLGISESSIRLELKKMRNKNRSRASGRIFSDSGTSVRELSRDRDNVEMVTLALLLMSPKFIERARREIDPSSFQHAVSRTVFNLLVRLFDEKGPSFSTQQVLSRCGDEPTKAFLSEVTFFELGDVEREKAFEDCLRALAKRELKQRMAQLQKDIREAEISGASTDNLIREYQDLLTQAK